MYSQRADTMHVSSVRLSLVALGAAALLGAVACQPTVKVEAPTEPIVINLNVKVEQEVRIKIDKEAEALLEEKSDLF